MKLLKAHVQASLVILFLVAVVLTGCKPDPTPGEQADTQSYPRVEAPTPKKPNGGTKVGKDGPTITIIGPRIGFDGSLRVGPGKPGISLF